jgi:AcrR family transcriptional regulator
MEEKSSLPLDGDKLSLILEAAQRRFGHYGVEKTTMSEIAADIGTSKASLYYYYPDKEHLFVAVMNKEMDEFIKAIKKLIEEDETASKKLKRYNSIRLGFFQKLVSLAKLSDSTITSLKTSLQEFKDIFLAKEKELVQTILNQGIREREFDGINAKAQADLFVTTMWGLRMLLHKKEIKTDEDYQKVEYYQKQFTSLFLKAITKS